MTAVITAGAASREPLHWQAIDWPKVYRIVRRLQARIVKARQMPNRVRQRAFERPERLEAKASRAVLWGRGYSNVAPLPATGGRVGC